MKPWEFILTKEEINLNVKGAKLTIRVKNTGDRPIQVGSHYHFSETNSYLSFDRKKALGFRLNVPAGSSVRFEPGQEKDVELTSFLGKKIVFGFNAKVNGKLKKWKLVEKHMLRCLVLPKEIR